MNDTDGDFFVAGEEERMTVLVSKTEKNYFSNIVPKTVPPASEDRTLSETETLNMVA